MTPDPAGLLSPYRGSRAAFATKHGKEWQFAWPLRRGVGIGLVVAGVDTDRFGTFTGEQPRTAGALDTARAKARAGMAATGLPRGLASEGSYGPNPAFPFVAVGEELAVWIDDERGLEVAEALVVHDTNFASCTVDSPTVPEGFLARTGFPSHHLVVCRADGSPVAKGVATHAALEAALLAALAGGEGAIVQADLRADRNPTRQRALRRLARALADRLAARCPTCRQPGWGRIGVGGALPCPLCGGPTNRPAFTVSACAAAVCGRRAETPVAEAGDAQWCPRCNP